jgi:hypothetical protein
MKDAERRERRKLLTWLDSSLLRMDTYEIRFLACIAGTMVLTEPELEELLKFFEEKKVKLSS